MSCVPRIGLSPYLDEMYGHHQWMRDTYVKAVFAAGGMPCILPYTASAAELERIARSMDGFLFTGGEDIDPVLYGQETEDVCGEICRKRDDYDLFLARTVIELDKPVIGICRGCQIINVAMGGTLIQDIPSRVGTAVCHDQEKDFERPTHEVHIQPGTRLYECIGQEHFAVNTWHHQAIDCPGEGLVINAVAPDGVKEGCEMPGKRLVLAVQWHPEYCVDTPNIGFFRVVVDAAKE